MKSQETPPEPKPSERQQMLRTFGLFGVIISTLVSSAGAGIGIGYWGWKNWGWPSWVIAITTALGLGLGFYRVYLISKKEWGA